LISQAGVYYKQYDFLNAYQLYCQALAVNSGSWEASMGAGNALYKLGRAKASLDYYRRSLDLNPANHKLAEFVRQLERQLKGESVRGVMTGAGQAIQWMKNYDSSMTRANAEHRYIMLVFYVEYGAGFPLMERKVFNDPDVLALSAEFVCCKVSGNRHLGLAEQYRVEAYPTLLFVDGQENVKKRSLTIKDPNKLIKIMKSVLAKQGKWWGDD